MRDFTSAIILSLSALFICIILVAILTTSAIEATKEYKDIITDREYVYINKGYNVTFNKTEQSEITILKDKHVNYFILVDSITLNKRFMPLD